MQVENLPSTHSWGSGVCSTGGGLCEETLKAGLQRPTEPKPTLCSVCRGDTACMRAGQCPGHECGSGRLFRKESQVRSMWFRGGVEPLED